MVKGVFDEKSPSKGNSFEGNFIWLKMYFLVPIFAVSATFIKPIKSRKTAWLGGFRGGQRMDSGSARGSLAAQAVALYSPSASGKPNRRKMGMWFESTIIEKDQAGENLLGLFGGQRWIRTTEGQIYSLIPLAARESAHIIGAGERTRTPDLLITNLESVK